MHQKKSKFKVQKLKIKTMKNVMVLVVICLTTVFTVIGDSFLKKASEQEGRFVNSNFLLGLAIYTATAFLWVFIYKMTKFSLSGIVYSIVGILMFVVVGVFMFGEKLSAWEYIGAGMAVSSVVILARFL